MRFQDTTLTQLRDLADLAVLIAAAADAGLFHSLAQGPATAAQLAAIHHYDERAVDITLKALTEAGLLTLAGGRFEPTARCREQLCDPSDAGYLGAGLPLWLRSIRSWSRLGEVLARGGPLEPGGKRRTPEEVARFMAGMAAAPRERVEHIVDVCLARHPDAASVLDVGGGPGHMTRAFVARGLAGTLFDTSEVTRHVSGAYGLAEVEGLDVTSGDLTADALPDGPFDILLVSNVMHIYPPEVNRRLMMEAARVVRPGGLLAVGEFLRGRSGKAARFGVQMLLKSEGGDAYSEADLTEWVEAAGFAGIQVTDLDPDRQLLTARRA